VAENDNGQEKTEEATPKRLDKAREEGQVARSKELTTTLVLLTGVAGLIVFGGGVSDALTGAMKYNFSMPRQAAFDDQLMLAHLAGTVNAAVRSLLGYFVLIALAGLLGPVMLGGFLISAKALAPKFSRIDPLKGLQRMFSMNALVELIKSIAKVLLVGSMAVVMLVFYQSELVGLSRSPVNIAMGDMLIIVFWSVLAVTAAMILVVAIDVPFQIFDHSKKIKMTRQEVRDEMKDTEGKPEVKGRIRQLQRDMAQRRMMEAVPEADVVITNPEHFSVALKYDVDGGGAPLVVAKGVDFMAMKIREVANANEVLIIQAAPLARAIYFTTEIDDEIPGNLYLAVAQVLAYVFQLRSHKQGTGRKPQPIGDIDLPREARYDVEGQPQPEN
jgi:flagellar biosynthetic protein FlhB